MFNFCWVRRKNGQISSRNHNFKLFMRVRATAHCTCQPNPRLILCCIYMVSKCKLCSASRTWLQTKQAAGSSTKGFLMSHHQPVCARIYRFVFVFVCVHVHVGVCPHDEAPGNELISHMSAQMSSLFNKAGELNCHYCQHLTVVLPARCCLIIYHSRELSDYSSREESNPKMRKFSSNSRFFLSDIRLTVCFSFLGICVLCSHIAFGQHVQPVVMPFRFTLTRLRFAERRNLSACQLNVSPDFSLRSMWRFKRRRVIGRHLTTTPESKTFIQSCGLLAPNAFDSAFSQ